MPETDLPAKPDVRTGEPRPPSAPLELGHEEPESRHKNGKNKVPPSPAGEGPILEWFYPTNGSSVATGLCVSGILVFALLIRDFSSGVMSPWWLWLGVIPWPFIFIVTGRNLRMSAGADWFQYRKKPFVKIYELSEVKAFGSGGNRNLDLKDSRGSGISMQLRDIQRNHKLWDLVYNGIVHSVHEHGAETNELARDALDLGGSPEY